MTNCMVQWTFCTKHRTYILIAICKCGTPRRNYASSVQSSKFISISLDIYWKSHASFCYLYHSDPGSRRFKFSFTLRDSPSDYINATCWGSEDYIRRLFDSFKICDVGEKHKHIVPSIFADAYFFTCMEAGWIRWSYVCCTSCCFSLLCLSYLLHCIPEKTIHSGNHSVFQPSGSGNMLGVSRNQIHHKS